MKSKSRTKKEAPGVAGENKLPVTALSDAEQQAPDMDDDLSHDEVKGLEEALKSADRGEPVTLKEFKKMAKKWGSK